MSTESRTIATLGLEAAAALGRLDLEHLPPLASLYVDGDEREVACQVYAYALKLPGILQVVLAWPPALPGVARLHAREFHGQGGTWCIAAVAPLADGATLEVWTSTALIPAQVQDRMRAAGSRPAAADVLLDAIGAQS